MDNIFKKINPYINNLNILIQDLLNLSSLKDNIYIDFMVDNFCEEQKNTAAAQNAHKLYQKATEEQFKQWKRIQNEKYKNIEDAMYKDIDLFRIEIQNAKNLRQNQILKEEKEEYEKLQNFLKQQYGDDYYSYNNCEAVTINNYWC